MEDRRVKQESAAALFAELLETQSQESIRTVGSWLHSSQLSGQSDACLLEVNTEEILELCTQTHYIESKHFEAWDGQSAIKFYGAAIISCECLC